MHKGVLVTGCTGAVGGMVVRELLERGDTPVGYEVAPDFRFLRDIEGQFECLRGDILDWPRVMDAVRTRRVDAIVHTAALLPDLATANPYQAVHVNIVGTANLVEAARAHGVRLVFCSTKGVMQDFTGPHGHPTYEPVTEDYPVIPPDNHHTLYNDTKVFCEHYLNRCAKLQGLDHVILRFASMFGPGRLRHGGRAALSEMIESALDRVPFTLPKGGDQHDDMVYLRDVAQACARAVHAPAPVRRTYVIGSGRVISYREAAEVVASLLPGALCSIGPGLDPFEIGAQNYGLLDNRRAREEIGYEPQYDLPSAIQDYVQLRAKQAV